MVSRRSSTRATGSFRWSSRAALAGALAVVCLGGTPPPSIAGPLREIASADVTLDRDLPLAVRSDTNRWYAYQEHRGMVVAVNTRAHTRLAIQQPGRCSLEDLRFGSILLNCRHDPLARIVSMPSGVVTDFPDIDPSSGQPFEDQFVALGRYWLGGYFCDGKCGQVFLNRRSMERRMVSDYDNPYPDRLVADIDSPGLASKDTTREVDVRTGGYRLTQDDFDDPLVLSHKGHHRTLSRCRPVCALATLGGGLVTWDDGKIRAYSLRLRRTFSWREPLRSPDDFVTDVVHTSTTLLVNTRDPHPQPARERLYAAGVPSRR
jgi:hypothetical protein